MGHWVKATYVIITNAHAAQVQCQLQTRARDGELQLEDQDAYRYVDNQKQA